MFLVRNFTGRWEVTSWCPRTKRGLAHAPTPVEAHSLRMKLVERPVHAHSHVEAVQPPVFADLIHHGGHACATQLRRPLGHHPAHGLHEDTVIARAIQAQLLEDGPDLQQR